MSNPSSVIIRPAPPKFEPIKSKRAALGPLFGLGLGGILGFVGVRYGAALFLPLPPPKALALLELVLLPVIWLVVVGFHELGHLIGGRLGGGRLLLWAVGPLMLRRTPAGLRFGLNRSVNLAGGMAASLPSDPTLMTPERAAAMIAGGPLASLVLSVAALWAAAQLAAAPAPITAIRAIAQHQMLGTAAVSLLIFLSSALPFGVGGFKSDGKRVYELLRGGPQSEQEAAMLVLTTASLAGQRPSGYDPTLVAKAVSLRDGSLFDLYGHLTAYYYYADRHDWAGAQSCLDHVLSGRAQLAPFIRDTLNCEYAWLLAEHTGDAAVARAWLEGAGRLDFDPATRLRAESAVLLAEGRREEAVIKAHEALHALEHKSMSPVKSPFASDALVSLIRRTTADA